MRALRRLSRRMVLLETLPVNSVASIYNRSSVPFDARFRRLLVKQAPAGYCICEKQHRAGSNQNRANTT